MSANTTSGSGRHYRTIDEFIQEKKITSSAPLSSLIHPNTNKHAVLAYDGNKVFADIARRMELEEPWAPLTTSVPATALTCVLEFAARVTKLREVVASYGATLTVTTVFDGFGFRPLEGCVPPPPGLPASLRAAEFRTADSVMEENPKLTEYVRRSRVFEPDVEAVIVEYWKRYSGCPVMRAPYLAWSQISAMLSEEQHYATDVIGSTEMLAFPGVDRVIVDIDLDGEERFAVKFVSKRNLLTKIQQVYGTFTPMDLSAVLLLQSQHPAFRIHSEETNGLRELVDFDSFCRDLAPAGAGGGGEEGAERRTQVLFRRVHAVEPLERNLSALSAPVLRGDGDVVPLNDLYHLNSTCSHYGTYFGDRAPAAVYLLHTFSPIVPEALGSVFHHAITDPGPYPDPLLEHTQATINNVRVHILHQAFGVFRHISPSVLWVRHGKADAFSTPDFEEITEWDIAPEDVPRLPPRYDASFSIVRALSTRATARREPGMYDGLEVTAAATLLKSLDMLGYFTHTLEPVVGEPTSGMFVFSEALDYIDTDTLKPYGVLLIELLRTNTLHDGPLDGEGPDVPNTLGYRFACRLLSTVHISVLTAWTGCYSASIHAFTQSVRRVSHTLRVLLVTFASLLFLGHLTTVPPADFDKVIELLPFKYVPEPFAGALMMAVLNPMRRVPPSLEELEAMFPNVSGLLDGLVTLFEFWAMAYRAMLCMVNRRDGPCIPLDPEVLQAAHARVAFACATLCPETHETLYAKLPPVVAYI